MLWFSTFHRTRKIKVSTSVFTGGCSHSLPSTYHLKLNFVFFSEEIERIFLYTFTHHNIPLHNTVTWVKVGHRSFKLTFVELYFCSQLCHNNPWPIWIGTNTPCFISTSPFRGRIMQHEQLQYRIYPQISLLNIYISGGYFGIPWSSSREQLSGR